MANQKKKKHIDRRTLLVRIVAIVCAVLIAGSALSVIIFGS
jgi:Na+-transporting NADH:ubiquinone oxidoreductase subunit NqrC